MINSVVPSNGISSHLPQSSTWGLITGVVRDESILLEKLVFFNSLKSSGYLNQVVFSTWKGELEKYELIKSALKSYNFILVESEEPDIICRGHYVHQIISIKNGIEVCPDNSFILRARTDKCGPEAGFVEEKILTFLSNRDFVRPCKDEFGPFGHKIGIMGYHTGISNTYPMFFFWNDRAYFGAKKDIQKFLNFNILALRYQALIPEQVLFAAPFLHNWPIISIFFDSANQSEIVDKIVSTNEKMSERLIKFLTESRLFQQMFITEKYLLHKYFYDISSGDNFEFVAKFLGVDMAHGHDIEYTFQQINNTDIHCSDFTAEIQELAEILKNEFSISPIIQVTHEVGEIERFSFCTPSSNLSITNRT